MCIFSEAFPRPTYVSSDLFRLAFSPWSVKEVGTLLENNGTFFYFYRGGNKHIHTHKQKETRWSRQHERKYSEAIVSRSDTRRCWRMITLTKSDGRKEDSSSSELCKTLVSRLISACAWTHRKWCEGDLTRGANRRASNWNTTALPTWDPAAPTCKGIMFYLFKQCVPRVCSAPCHASAVFYPLRLFGPVDLLWYFGSPGALLC